MNPLAAGMWHGHASHAADIKRAVEWSVARLPGHGLAVGTGWSGPKTLFEIDVLRPLREFIRAVLPGDSIWGLDGWANVMRAGDSIGIHDHVKSHHGGVNAWSGVYYLQHPENAPRLEVGQISVLPVPGLVVLFPATTPHFVPPGSFEGERISIAFNARELEAP